MARAETWPSDTEPSVMPLMKKAISSRDKACLSRFLRMISWASMSVTCSRRLGFAAREHRFDVAQQARGAEAEGLGRDPAFAHHLIGQRQIVSGIRHGA